MSSTSVFSSPVLQLDHTRRSAYTACPRKYYWSHVRNLRSAYGSVALLYGSTWHEFLDATYSFVKQNGWLSSHEEFVATVAPIAAVQAKAKWDKELSLYQFNDIGYRSFQNCLESYLSYLNHYQNDRNFLKVLDVETRFCIDMPGDWQYVGKYDLRVLLSGAPYVLEHKTTSQYLATQVNSLHRSAQVIGYNYAANQTAGERHDGCLISIHHLSARKNKSGEWGSLKVEFERSPQLYSQGDFTSWLEMMCFFAERIRRSHALDTWPMCFDACYNYGKCSYTNLCEQNRPLGEENTTGYVTFVWDPLTDGMEDSSSSGGND